MDVSTYLVVGELLSGETVKITAESTELAEAAMKELAARPDIVNVQSKMISEQPDSQYPLERAPGESIPEFIDRLHYTASRVPNTTTAGRAEFNRLQNYAAALQAQLGGPA